MPLKPPPSAPVFEKLTPGLYPAVVVGVMYLGELGKTPNLRIEFEIVGKSVEKNGKTYAQVLGEDFFFYWAGKNGKSKLAELCENICGCELDENSFDLYDLLGKSCEINVVIKDAGNGKSYENIAGAKPWLGEPMIHARELLRFDFDENFPNYVKLPNFLKNKIATAANFPAQHSQGKTQQGGSQQQQSAPAKPGEEIPF